MNLPAQSDDYEYVRIKYPSNLDNKCILCQFPVVHLYADAGKLVHRLEGDIYQVVELYRCTNPDCKCSTHHFNPSPRYDYGKRFYGADVFRFVAREFLPPLKQNPDQIRNRLRLMYPNFRISPATISRMCDDILKVKSFNIDLKTHAMIQEQGFILLGMDGQDPGTNAPAIWAFMDLISNRILATVKFETLDYNRLHEYLTSLEAYYGVPILGWVTDKQNVIVKCHDTFYAEIPHQYCQYHFQTHLWNHIECLDSKIFMPLKKVITKLYIHSASLSKTVDFGILGRKSVREVFKPMDQDLQAMIRMRNKKFKSLRGLWLFEKLTEYINRGRQSMKEIDSELRVAKIMKKTFNDLQEKLDGVRHLYEEVVKFNTWFQEIRDLFNTEQMIWQEKRRQLDLVFKAVYQEACKQKANFDLDACRSFLPGKKSTFIAILGEWCRLWNSYLPGLFQYEKFPGKNRTNGKNERAFSKEKQMLIARVGKGIVSHMIATRGADYLRLTHCSPEELTSDILIECTEGLIQELREELRTEIRKQTRRWRTNDRQYLGFEGIKLTLFNALASSNTSGVLKKMGR